MSGQSLQAALEETIKNAKQSLAESRVQGELHAQKDREYKIAVAKAIREEKAAGTPATLIISLVKGREDIAKLAFERDTAEVMYKTALEAVNLRKKEADGLREQIEREWNRSGGSYD